MKTRALRVLPLAVLGLLLGVGRASAGDVTAFVTFPSPSDEWNRGYGAALSTSWFQAINLEGEAARIPGALGDSKMTSFTGSALLAPPLGLLVPYGGFGIGLYQQTVGDDSDTGVLRCFVLGAKLKLGLAVLKGEYRRTTLPDDALIEMDHRYSFGAGVSF
jgi:hypothetical protein